MRANADYVKPKWYRLRIAVYDEGSSLKLSFAQVSGALATAYEIADEKRGAFVARLQHIQRLKYPPGINTGRGRAAEYRVEHLYQLALIIELGQLGLTPERSAAILLQNSEAVAEAAQMVAGDGPVKTLTLPEAMEMLAVGSPEGPQTWRPVVITLDPVAFSAALRRSLPGAADMSLIVKHWRLNFALPWVGMSMASGAFRIAVINISSTFSQCVQAMCPVDGEIDEFYAALGGWAEQALAREDSYGGS